MPARLFPSAFSRRVPIAEHTKSGEQLLPALQTPVWDKIRRPNIRLDKIRHGLNPARDKIRPGTKSGQGQNPARDKIRPYTFLES